MIKVKTEKKSARGVHFHAWPFPHLRPRPITVDFNPQNILHILTMTHGGVKTRTLGFEIDMSSNLTYY